MLDDTLNFFLLKIFSGDYILLRASQVALVVKNPPANVGDIRDVGSILGLEDPREQEMATHSSIFAEESHGQRNLLGNSPWGHKELGMTKRTHTYSIIMVIFLIVENVNKVAPGWKLIG